MNESGIYFRSYPSGGDPGISAQGEGSSCSVSSQGAELLRWWVSTGNVVSDTSLSSSVLSSVAAEYPDCDSTDDKDSNDASTSLRSNEDVDPEDDTVGEGDRDRDNRRCSIVEL